MLCYSTLKQTIKIILRCGLRNYKFLTLFKADLILFLFIPLPDHILFVKKPKIVKWEKSLKRIICSRCHTFRSGTTRLGLLSSRVFKIPIFCYNVIYILFAKRSVQYKFMFFNDRVGKG